MYPTLLTVLGLPISSYGVSKALAAVVAALLLRQEFRRLGWDPEVAVTMVTLTTVAGFIGAKVYYLAEHAHQLTRHDLGSAGFTWYGGLITGATTFLILARRYHLPQISLAAAATAPLSVAYGIGRLGCLLAGDGTYGRPSNLPWAIAFPNGTVPTTIPVHPTPAYEAIIAFALAGLLWAVRRRWTPQQRIATYLIGSGAARALVEVVRINDQVLLGLTQPQIWSIVLIIMGMTVMGVRSDSQRNEPRRLAAEG